MPTIGDLTSLIDSLKRRARDNPLRTAGDIGTGMAASVGDLLALAHKGLTPFADTPEYGDKIRGIAEDSGLGDSFSPGFKLGELVGPPAKLLGKIALAAGPIGKVIKSGQKAGQIRGTQGLGGITPERAAELRENMINDALLGGPHSKYWYDEASKDLHRIAGSEKERSTDLAKVMATLSSGTPVDSNTMYGFKGWNQNLVGDKVDTGMYPNAMRDTLETIFRGGDTTGMKREPFKDALSVEFSGLSKEEKDALRPINDIHQASAASGKKIRRGLSTPEHQFVDDQTTDIVPELNRRAQAAIDAARARGASEAEIAKMDQPDWNRYRVQSAIWPVERVRSGKADTLEEAAKHFGDFFPSYMAHVTRENIPGATTGHLPELLKPGMEQARETFDAAVEPFFRGPQGIDAIAHEMGMLSDTTLSNPGVYLNERNPGHASRIAVGKTKGTQEMDESSRKGVEAMGALHAMLTGQQQVGGNFVGGPSPAVRMGALLFNRDKPIVGDELKKMQTMLMDRKITPTEGDAYAMEAAQADPRGARSLAFLRGGDSGQQLDAAREVAEQFGATAEPRHASTVFFPTAEDGYSAPAKFSMQPFIDKVMAAGPKVVAGADRYAAKTAIPYLETVEKQAQQLGLTQASWFRPAMKALAEGGVSRLQELVRQGIVPAAALAALGLPLLQGNSDATSQ